MIQYMLSYFYQRAFKSMCGLHSSWFTEWTYVMAHNMNISGCSNLWALTYSCFMPEVKIQSLVDKYLKIPIIKVTLSHEK